MTDREIVDRLVGFLDEHYREEVIELAGIYPDEKHIEIDYDTLWRFDPDIADDVLSHPDRMYENIETAVEFLDIPVPVTLDDIDVYIIGLNDEHVYAPNQIRQEHGGQYVGIRGVLDRVTTSSDIPRTLVYECQRCPNRVHVPQSPNQSEPQQPHVCEEPQGCGRQGPWKVVDNLGEWSDYVKLRVEARPDGDSSESGNITGYALDDLIDFGGGAGLIERAGEPVTVYGIVRRSQKSGRGENAMLFDHVLDVRGIEFVRDRETIDVDAHRETFEDLAAREDAVDLFADSIAPNLHGTDAWEAAFEFVVAYLFGAPRIDIPDGPTYRGDMHFMMISDFGMGKSDFMSDVEKYSPNCLSKSTTALSSDVGLTAAAVKDDFGEGQWTLKPGLLVRANGGHLLLDEIDKGPDQLNQMNDALEGEQVVDVEKAGMSATYQSRTAVMAIGNPKNGRFNEHDAISEQLGIDDSLLSRFDGIVTMLDKPDIEQDKKIARSFGKGFTESLEYEYGDREEFDSLERFVPVDVGRAWIKHARESVNPLLTYEQYAELEEWYAEEVRQLNNTFASNSGDGADMPVPATVRDLAAAVKMSLAFARVRLLDEVQPEQIERAKKLSKRLIRQNWNGEEFDVTKNMSASTETDPRDVVYDILAGSGGRTESEIVELATDRGHTEAKIRRAFEKLKRAGEVYEPKSDGVFHTT